MLLPRTLIESNETGFRPLIVIFTAFKCVFMAISTPDFHSTYQTNLPVIVPTMIVPFFNSIVTLSVESFIKNL
jgi:hypothetical protein